MPSPKGDLRILCESMQGASSLLGFAKVLPGKNALAASGAPPRVVMFPVGGHNDYADDRTVSASSGWFMITAHFWATDTDNAFDLKQRWIQALRAQADAGGYYWKFADGENERWDVAPDTSQQGQEFEIDIVIRLDVALEFIYRGTVQATTLSRVATLTAGINSATLAAPVDATFEQLPSGVLHIDDEQISYSGVTATSFTGLTRGINGTTAAAHASGTAVYVTPT